MRRRTAAVGTRRSRIADDVNAVNPQTRMPLALAATPAGAIAAVTPFGDLAGGPDIWIWSAPAKR